MKKITIVVYLIFATAFTPIAARFAVNEIPPLTLAFLRFSIACVLLTVIFLYRKNSYSIDKKDYFRFLILGALVIPINQFCFLKGVSMSSASHSGVIYSATPLFAYIISIGLKSEKFNFRKLSVIIMSILGIFVIFYENLIKIKTSDSNVFWGDVLLVCAVMSWAAYLTLSSDMVHKYGAVKTSTVSFTIGLIMYIPVFLLDVKNLDLSRISFLGGLAFFHLAILVSFGSYFIFTYSTKLISVSSLTTSLNSSPIVTILFSSVLLNEELSLYFIIGAVITITGVFLAQFFKDRNNKEPEISIL